MERALRDSSPAEARDDVVDLRSEAGEGEADVLPDNAPDPDRERLLDHDDPPGMLQGGTDLLEGVGPEAPDADGADLHTLFPQLVDDLLDRSKHGAERDDDRVRVRASVGMNQSAGAAADGLGELAGDLRD